jgi:hypothetical protein
MRGHVEIALPSGGVAERQQISNCVDQPLPRDFARSGSRRPSDPPMQA